MPDTIPRPLPVPPSPPLPVIAALDGSADDLEVARWAAREAALRGTGLRLVHLSVPALPLAPAGAVAPVRSRRLLESADLARRSLTRIARTVVDDDPALPVAAALAHQDPVGTLRRLTGSAVLTVVGAAGVRSGGLGRQVTSALAGGSTGPVAVLRRDPADGIVRSDGPVVVAVDAGRDTAAAVDWAADRAARAAVPLLAVAVPGRSRRGDRASAAAAGADVVAEAEAYLRLDSALTAVRERHSGLDVRPLAPQGDPVAELLAVAATGRAAGAPSLLVVGRRPAAWWRVGAAARRRRAVLAGASCPVAVVGIAPAGGARSGAGRSDRQSGR
ncbi:universal stress protein [Nakamurella endophytica]|uniref:UspA domain-containing protein n=1 Tax=Nakamurella endophytica TaxID=1748367 RepID=A0A917WIH9_9ACTN|nr:universal stress protein [Nakamurella endophytica]GGM07511.1 hypothetical protein GCM10011594_29330 [Nakamurella endophytica]